MTLSLDTPEPGTYNPNHLQSRIPVRSEITYQYPPSSHPDTKNYFYSPIRLIYYREEIGVYDLASFS